jgi:transposase
MALRWRIPQGQRRRISMALLRAQPAIAGAMGVSLSTVNRAHMAYDQRGIKTLRPKPCGRSQGEIRYLHQQRKPGTDRKDWLSRLERPECQD